MDNKHFSFALVFFLFLLIISCSGDVVASNSVSNDSVQATTATKIKPDALTDYLMGITDASSLGIKRENVGYSKGLNNSSKNSLSKRNYLVKTEYSANDPSINSDNTLAVSFTRITTENVEEDITGSANYIATDNEYDVTIISITENNFTIASDIHHEYRIIDSNNIIKDWFLGNPGCTVVSDVEVSKLDELTLECRSINATLSFFATNGFSYSVYDSQHSRVYEGITDNCNYDKDSRSGIIVVDGLIQGQVYTVEYSGKGEMTTITQDDIDAQIDKVYVVGEYIFLSFVPLDWSSRPADDDLQVDNDGIALYDKTNYYSDSYRQSFIVNNTTGRIYPISNFYISHFINGLIVGSDNAIYDLQSNPDDTLSIYTVFNHPNAKVFNCFKDKYGTAYIINNTVNYEDENTKYVFLDWQSGGKIDYCLTTTGEVIKIDYSSMDYQNIVAEVVIGKNITRPINSSDSFVIVMSQKEEKPTFLHKIVKGVLYISDYGLWRTYGASSTYDYFEHQGFISYDCSLSSFNSAYVVFQGYGHLLATYIVDNVLLVNTANNQNLYAIIDPCSYVMTYNDFNNQSITNYGDRAILLAEQYKWDWKEKKFYNDTPYGKAYYDVRIDKDSDGNTIGVSLVPSQSSSNNSLKVIILQPLKR